VQEKWSVVIMLCSWCGKEFDETKKPSTTRARIKKRGYGYCCRACAYQGTQAKQEWTAERRAKSAEHMKKINAEYHDQIMERMTKRNPMKNPETRAKVSARLKEMEHKPRLHGGNGTGMTKPQEMLVSEILKRLTDLTIFVEYPIPTKVARDSGYPTCYKVDIALVEPMIAIEIDGSSHCSLKRQEQDRKKEQFLNGLGWTVLRFKNQQVMEHSEDCVQTVMCTISK
jgi:hypothetical protein